MNPSIVPPAALRVAVFHTTLPEGGRKLGGVEVTVHRLANALVEHAGCRVTVYSCSPPPADALYHHVSLADTSRARNKFYRLVCLPFRLNFLDFRAFDVLHLHGDDWFFLKRQIPTVRTLHGSAKMEAKHAGNWKRRALQRIIYPLEQFAARSATVAVAVGAEAAAIYHAERIVNNGVDERIFRPRAKAREPLLIYVGTWEGRKRGKLAYETFVEKILPRWPACRLYMACDFVPDHAGVIDGHNPKQDVLADWMAKAWIFFYPSVYEGFGIPYIEALASGTAIVTTPNSGAEHVLAGGRFGHLVHDEGLAESLLALLADPAERGRLEDAGLEHAACFAWPKVGKEHVEIFQSAIQRFAR